MRELNMEIEPREEEIYGWPGKMEGRPGDMINFQGWIVQWGSGRLELRGARQSRQKEKSSCRNFFHYPINFIGIVVLFRS